MLLVSLCGADITTDYPLSDKIERRTPGLTEKDRDDAASFALYASAIDSFLKKRKFDEDSVKAILESVEKAPDSKELIQLTFSRGNKFAQSPEFIERAYEIAKLNPQSPSLAISAASLMIPKENAKAREILENAKNYMEDHEERFEKESNAYIAFVVLLAEIYSSDNDFRSGDRMFRRAASYKQIKDNFIFLRNAAEFYTEMSQSANENSFLFFKSDKEEALDKAESYMNKLEELASSGESPAPNLAPLIKFYKTAGTPERAVKIILSSLLAKPDDKELLILLADAYNEEDAPSLALRTWKQIFAHHKIHPRFYLNMGITAMKAQRFKDAVDALEKYLIAYPDNKSIYYSLAVAQLNAGEAAKAITSIAKSQENYESDYIKAMAYLKLNDYRNSMLSLITAQRRATAKNDQNFLNRAFYLTLAFAADKAGEPETIIKNLSPLIEKNPDDHEILNFIGYTIVDKGGDMQKAEEYLRKAVKLQPENPAYLDSLAWLCYKKGEMKEALSLIKKSLSNDLDPADAVISDHAGDIFAANGDMKNAVKYWQNALSVYSTELKPETVQKKIKDAAKDAL